MSNLGKSFLEVLAETAVEVTTKPGVFSIDSQALRALLFELVRAQKSSGDGSATNLLKSNDKLMQELATIKLHIKQVDKKVDQMSVLFETVSRLEETIDEIRENEKVISESTNLLIADVDALRSQLEEMEENALIQERSASDRQSVTDILERIEALETSSSVTTQGTRKSMSVTQKRSGMLAPERVRKRSSIRKKLSIFQDIRLQHMSRISLDDKGSLEPLPEMKPNLAKPFMELKEKVKEMGMETMMALEDFLITFRQSSTLHPKTVQELFIIFSDQSADLFSLVVKAINDHPPLTISAFSELLEMFLTSACNCNTMMPIWNMLCRQSSKLPLDALCSMMRCAIKSTQLTPKGLTELLGMLSVSDELWSFLSKMKEFESFSWKGLINIVQELHFAKYSTLLEMVSLMESLPSSELNELLYMLMTIPGYVNELILSLPCPPSQSTQRLLEHLLCLPDDSPTLLAQTVELMVSTQAMRQEMLGLMRQMLTLTEKLESKSRNSDTGFFQLLNMLHSAGDVTLGHVENLVTTISGHDPISLDAILAILQTARKSRHDFVGAWRGLMLTLIDCPDMRREVIQRVLRLLERAQFTTTKHIEELLHTLKKSRLLLMHNFQPVMDAFCDTELFEASNLQEFCNMLKTLDFLTLDSLGHIMEQNQATAEKAHEEAMARHQKRQEAIEARERLSMMQEKESEEGTPTPTRDTHDGSETDLKVPSEKPVVSVTSGEAIQVTAPHAPTSEVAVEPTVVQEMQKELKELQAAVQTLQEAQCKKVENKKRGSFSMGTDDRRAKRSGQKVKKTKGKNPASSGEESDIPTSKQESEIEELAEERTSAPLTVDTEKTSLEEAEEVLSENEEEEEASGSGTPSGTPQSESSHRSLIFQELRGEISSIKDTMSHLSDHAKECLQRYEWIVQELALKTHTEELKRFKEAVRKQLHNFAIMAPPGPAGSKQRIAVNCLSCDTEAVKPIRGVEHSLPVQGAFPPVMTQKPHRLYEMDLIKKHARSLLEGNNDRSAIDLYSAPRPCGGQHTSVDVRQTWTYEVHHKTTRTCSPEGQDAATPKIPGFKKKSSKKSLSQVMARSLSSTPQ